jgi:hypothetical protein
MYSLNNLRSSVAKLPDKKILGNLQSWRESVARRRKIKKKKKNWLADLNKNS